MAPSFRAGKGSFVWFNSVDMSQVTQTVTASRACKALDVTHYGQNDENYTAGLKGGTYSLGGLNDASTKGRGAAAPYGSSGNIDIQFMNALAASTQPVLTYGYDGTTIGRRCWLIRAETVKYDSMAPVADVVKFAAGGQFSSGIPAGIVLHSMKAETSTNVYSGVDSGYAGGTTAGGVGVVHLTNATTIATFQVKIQHSTAGVSWADLITFSSSTGTTGVKSVQRSTVAGTVKQFTRATAFKLTGGSSKSATFGVAFARHGNRK